MWAADVDCFNVDLGVAFAARTSGIKSQMIINVRMDASTKCSSAQTHIYQSRRHLKTTAHVYLEPGSLSPSRQTAAVCVLDLCWTHNCPALEVCSSSSSSATETTALIRHLERSLMYVYDQYKH